MDKKKLKIGIVTFTLEGGGAQRIAINLAKYFNKKKYSTDLILIKNINEYLQEFPDLNKNLKIHTILTSTSKIPKKFLLFKIIQTFIILFKLIKKNKYDLLIGCVETYPYYYAVIISRIFRIKSLLIIHFNINDEFKLLNILKRTFHKFLFRKSLSLTDSIICVSKGVAMELEKFMPEISEKVKIIYNGFDVQHIKNLSQNQPENSGLWKIISEKYLLTIGHYVDRKNQELLIDSFTKIREKIPDLKLVIIGRGPLKQYLIKKVGQLNLKGKIYILDFMPNPYVFMKYAKLFILASRYEGFANVLVDVMSCGTPVLSVDCPYGPREIISLQAIKFPFVPVKKITYAEYGILVPPEKNRIVEATIDLLKSRNLQEKYQKAGLDRAQYFSLEKMGKHYLSVINDLFVKKI